MLAKKPYTGKFWWGKILANHTGKSFWWRSIWRISYMPNVFSVYLWILVRKSLANSSQLAKFANFSPCQNFPVYGSCLHTHVAIYCILIVSVATVAGCCVPSAQPTRCQCWSLSWWNQCACVKSALTCFDWAKTDVKGINFYTCRQYCAVVN